jgi:hypothetical protein
MRHLFLPACLCLMTLSNPTSSESGLSMEQFSGVNSEIKEASVEIAGAPVAREENKAEDVPAAVAEDKTEEASDPDAENSASAAPAADPQIPLPAPRPTPKPVVARSNQEICDTLIESAQTNNLPVPFFIHLLFRESHFKPDAVSPAGAQGIAQFMPETAANVGLDNPFDPLQAIAASARLLRDLVRQFGNVGLAAAAYNAGPRRIHDWLAKKGKLPDETQTYVKIITGRPAATWTSAAKGGSPPALPRQAPCQQAARVIAASAAPDAPARPDLRVSGSRSASRAMIAARAHGRLARRTIDKTPAIVAAERSGQKPGKAAEVRAAKSERGAVQLAAASKKKHHRLQLSQR